MYFVDASVQVAQIFRHDLKSILEQRAIAQQDATALKRLKEPLVRIERQGVHLIKTDEGFATALAENSGCSISAIGVQPHFLLPAEFGEFRKRVHCAGVGGACVGDDAKRA